MTMTISRETYQKTVDLLLPYLGEANRENILRTAFYPSPLLNQIRYTGDNSAFTAHVVKQCLDYGQISDGEPAIVSLLEALKPQVGFDVQSRIEELITQIHLELSTPRPQNVTPAAKKPRQSSNRVLYAILGIGLLLILGGVGAIYASGLFNENPASPTITSTLEQTELGANSTNTVNNPENATLGDFTIQLIYSDENAFNIFIEEDSDISQLEIRAGNNTNRPEENFDTISLLNGHVTQGMCFRYVLDSSQTTPPRACSGSDVFVTQLNQSDVFWYDFSRNSLLDTAVHQQGNLVSLCSAAQTMCSITTQSED